jgi:hypothetical protein
MLLLAWLALGYVPLACVGWDIRSWGGKMMVTVLFWEVRSTIHLFHGLSLRNGCFSKVFGSGYFEPVAM